MSSWKIAVDYQFARDCYDCYIYRDVGDYGDVREYQQPGGIWKRVEPGMMPVDLVPSFTLYRHIAAALIEALASHGFTPRLQTLTEGKLDAQTAHLKDLQAILRKQGYMA